MPSTHPPLRQEDIDSIANPKLLNQDILPEKTDIINHCCRPATFVEVAHIAGFASVVEIDSNSNAVPGANEEGGIINGIRSGSYLFVSGTRVTDAPIARVFIVNESYTNKPTFILQTTTNRLYRIHTPPTTSSDSGNQPINTTQDRVKLMCRNRLSATLSLLSELPLPRSWRDRLNNFLNNL